FVNAGEDLLNRCSQAVFRNYFVDEPQTQGVFGGESFAGEGQLIGFLWADQLRQHDGGKGGKYTHLDLRLREIGVGRGDDHVSKSHQLGARTDGGAIDHDDQGLGDIAECLEDAVEGVQGLKDAVGFGVFERNSGAECLLRRVEDDALDVVAS